MKRITTLAFLGLPITVVASLFGMNVEAQPFDGAPFEFWIITGLGVLATIVIYIVFKFKSGSKMLQLPYVALRPKEAERIRRALFFHQYPFRKKVFAPLKPGVVSFVIPAVLPCMARNISGTCALPCLLTPSRAYSPPPATTSGVSLTSRMSATSWAMVMRARTRWRSVRNARKYRQRKLLTATLRSIGTTYVRST